jgi:hypothetical protein
MVSGIGRDPFRAEDFLKAALGGRDLAAFGPAFGPAQFMEGLRILLAALDDEADLSVVGRIAARWDAVRCLRNLIQMRDAEDRSPAIATIPIQRPLIITGLPRSGTTFLHRLLDCDPRTLSPACWQTMAPYPPERGRDRRIETTDRQLRSFARMAPGFRDVHPLSATMPQECTEITAQIFQSLRYDTTFRVPRYLDWLDAHGHDLAYRFHKRFLQHLQHQTVDDAAAVQWVLKCPDHVFALDAIHAVYPDARIVFVHRDPLKVLPSVARLTEILRKPFARTQNAAEIGAQVTSRWRLGVEAMARAADDDAAGAIFHIQYRTLTDDPLATVTALYDHFQMPLNDAARAAMQTELSRTTKGGYGDNVYRFSDHGLDANRERAHFAEYMHRFDVAEEVALS